MAYDEELADRIRELVSGEPGLTEQKMFGGLAFLIGGNMAVAASGQGASSFMSARTIEGARRDYERSPDGDAGSRDEGWLRVGAEDVPGKHELAEWVERGTAYARSLPAKR
jgi:hypothetical protein